MKMLREGKENITDGATGSLCNLAATGEFLAVGSHCADGRFANCMAVDSAGISDGAAQPRAIRQPEGASCRIAVHELCCADTTGCDVTSLVEPDRRPCSFRPLYVLVMLPITFSSPLVAGCPR